MDKMAQNSEPGNKRWVKKKLTYLCMMIIMFNLKETFISVQKNPFNQAYMFSIKSLCCSISKTFVSFMNLNAFSPNRACDWTPTLCSNCTFCLLVCFKTIFLLWNSTFLVNLIYIPVTLNVFVKKDSRLFLCFGLQGMSILNYLKFTCAKGFFWACTSYKLQQISSNVKEKLAVQKKRIFLLSQVTYRRLYLKCSAVCTKTNCLLTTINYR